MRTTAMVFSCIWIVLGLMVGIELMSVSPSQTGDLGALLFGGAIAVFSALTALFLYLRKDAAAESCVLGAGLLSFPIGLVLIFIVKAATRKKSTS